MVQESEKRLSWKILLQSCLQRLKHVPGNKLPMSNSKLVVCVKKHELSVALHCTFLPSGQIPHKF